MKTELQLEKIMKGVANHRRIQMLVLLDRQPELSLHDICTRLRINLKTGSEHLRRLVIAGLVSKRNLGRTVRHSPTRRAENILTFLRKLD